MINEEFLNKRKKLLDAFSVENRKNKVNSLMSAELLDMNEAEKWIDYRYTVSSDAINVIGTMHGGVTAGLMDQCMGLTADLFALDGKAATTSDMQFNCVKPIFEGDELRIHTILRHMGKRTMVAQSEIWRGEELCAFSTENFGVIDLEKIVNHLKK